jgi:hypothetical protein
MSGEGGAARWLDPLLPAFPELTAHDAAMLGRFEDALRGLLEAHPVTRPADAEERSRNLREIRRGLAKSGYLALAVPARDGGHGRPPVVQVLLQFTSGYHDVDQADGVALWKQLKSSGFRPKSAFPADASDGDSWWQSPLAASLRTPCQGVTGAPARPRPDGSPPSPTLGRKYAGNLDYDTAEVAYAVAEVLTDALAKAGSTNSGTLNTAISQTDARTTAGLITFNQATHTAVTPYYVTQWQNGKLVSLEHAVTENSQAHHCAQPGQPTGPPGPGVDLGPGGVTGS